MIKKPNPQKKSFVIDIWQGKAYIPAQARYDSGIYSDIEPVYIVSLKADDLISALRNVIALGITRLPSPKTREEILTRKDPILKATGARSWKELARTGSSYSIDWTEKQVRIDMSRLDKQGRWEYDPNKVTILDSDTPLEDIIEIILKDLNERNKQKPK